MKYWYETPADYITIEYGRYEAFRDISLPRNFGAFTYTTVLAGPEPPTK